eukprot:CCRYP_013733-RB/>CCRYP_013733-RB protein AED:0.50 eAED:0.50 QI:0/-1/0/1/-1/0/1/0/8
MDMSFHWL